jgi:hypothetical protein
MTRVQIPSIPAHHGVCTLYAFGENESPSWLFLPKLVEMAANFTSDLLRRAAVRNEQRKTAYGARNTVFIPQLGL